jgi:hypothetical protein
MGALALAGLGSVPCTQAALIQTLPGNDCSGLFGQGFNECQIPTNFDPSNSPIIIKFNFTDNGSISSIERNLAEFPTITGDEFTFNFSGGGVGDGNDPSDGSWTYTPGAGDPLSPVTYYVAKGGPNFNLFSNPGTPNTNTYSTPINANNGTLFGLSHLSFYDTGLVPPPPPAEIIPEVDALAGTGALVLVVGVLTLPGERRRKV